MRIVFFGTPEFAVPSLRSLVAHPEIEVVAVVTQPDKRRGRGTELSPSPVKTVALEHHLPVWSPVRVKKDGETLAKLQASDADAFAVVAYGQILSQEILDMPRLGCVNTHGSLLPKYRGAAPIQWSLYHGETETGITTMLMDAGMDTGAMLLKSHTPIGLMDNAWDLSRILADQAAALLIETLFRLKQQDIQPIPQDHNAATYAPLIKKEDYSLDWSRPAIALHNQIRGFYPNVVTTFRQDSLKLLSTVPLEVADDLPPDLKPLEAEFAAMNDPLASPGTVVGILKNQGAVVKTGEGRLLLKEVQLPGKRPQSGWDMVNGAHLSVGEILGL